MSRCRPSAQEPQPSPGYSRTVTFGAVRLSQDQLLGVLRSVEALAATANAGVKEQEVERSLVVEEGGRSVSVTGPLTAPSLAGAADPVSIVRYSYRVWAYRVNDDRLTRIPCAVEKIELTIWTSARQATVSGRSQEQVEAIAAVLAAAVNDWRPAVTGGQIEKGLLALTFMIFLALWIMANVAPAFMRARMLALPLVTLLPLFLPWGRWFPDAAVYRGEPSLIERYSGLFTFLGFLLTVLSMIWVLFKGAGQRVTNDAAQKVAPSAGTSRDRGGPDTGYRGP